MNQLSRNRIVRTIVGMAFKASVLVILLNTSACVTTTDGPFDRKADSGRLVDISVTAASRYIQENSFEDAHRHLTKALATDKRSPKVHNTYALLYRVQGEYELSEKHYKLALKYDSNYSQAHNNFGTLLYSLGRYDEAIAHLRKSANDPTYDRRAQAFENMGRNYLKIDDQENAKSSFRRAVRLDSRVTRSYIELARMSLAEQQYVNAANYIKQYDAVARHTPESLWLGIQAQNVIGDKNVLASYELALKNLYPESEEYQWFLSGSQPQSQP